MRDTNLRTLTTEELTDLVQTVKDSKAAASMRLGQDASASSSQTSPSGSSQAKVVADTWYAVSQIPACEKKARIKASL